MSPVKQGAPRVSLRTSEARRAEVASTRSKAQCAATEHRASEAQSGAKTRSDHAELRGGRTASALCAHRRPEGLKWRAHEAKRSAQSKAAKRLEARGAHEARALWAKQRVVSPMRQGAPQASLRAMRNDHAELWTQSEAKSAGAEHRAAEDGTVRNRRQRSGWSPEGRTKRARCARNSAE